MEELTVTASPDQIARRVEAVCAALGLSLVEGDVQAAFPHLPLSATTPAARAQPTPPASIASLVDHTLLKQEAREEEIKKLCQEASQYGFAAVCVNGCWAQLAIDTLRSLRDASSQKHDVKVACVVGFPLGATTPETKAFETKQLVEMGVDEIDMVVNVGRLKDKAYAYVLDDIKAVVNAATRPDGSKATVKVILETGALQPNEIIDGCILSTLAGAHFVKTSTGFNAVAGGAKVEHVALMKNVVGDRLEVKASGGVRSAADVQAMVTAGATRIGTSSGVALVSGESNKTGY